MFPLESVRRAYAGSVVYPPGGRFGPRLQQDVQLVQLYTGEMEVTIDGRPHLFQPGQVVLLMPGHEESFVFSRTEETWHRWIAVHLDPLAPELLHYLYGLPACLPLTDRMNGLTEVMISVLADASPEDPLMRSLGLSALHLYPTESDRFRRQNEKHPAVHRALLWIRDHYGEEASLGELARFAGVSPEHLVRLFRRYEGTTPLRYIWRYRVEQAVALLRHTGLTVSEIAQRCGFKTSHHFARTIRLAVGAAPSQIRQPSGAVAAGAYHQTRLDWTGADSPS